MNKYLYIFILSVIVAAEADAQNAAKTSGAHDDVPRLVVNISIDQLKADYLQEFLPRLGSNGLKKLLQEGLVYENVSCPFFPVDRSSASAVLSSGTVPFYNGIPSGEWMSRKSMRLIQSTTDQVSLLTPRGGAPTPVNLVVSTIGDELKIATKNQGKVYSVAPECDAAIMLAGHVADGVAWIDRQSGLWTSSAYYAKTTPEWIASYNKSNPAAKKIKSDVHALTGATRVSDYLTSDVVNNDVTEMAINCLAVENLGMDDVPDILNVQYYAGTFRHLSVYDNQTQLSATYAKLDAAIVRLVNVVQQRVGAAKVLFVVSSTGYFDEPVIDYTQHRVPSGTVYVNRTSNLLNMYLSAIYGQAHYVDGYHDNQIYINHKIVEQKRLKLNEVLERSREMLILSDGIRNAYTSFGLTSASDPDLKLLRNGYNVDVCGDLILDVAPGWKVLNEDNNRCQKWSQYGFAFPVVFYGMGVKAAKVSAPVSADQIAPTICKSIHIRAPNACKSACMH